MAKEVKAVYTKTTKDIYEFPLFMADSLIELAKMCGTSPEAIASCITHTKQRKRKNGISRSQYHKVILISDEEELQDETEEEGAGK